MIQKFINNLSSFYSVGRLSTGRGLWGGGHETMGTTPPPPSVFWRSVSGPQRAAREPHLGAHTPMLFFFDDGCRLTPSPGSLRNFRGCAESR